VLFARESEAIHDQTLEALGWVGRSRLGLDCVKSFFGGAELPVELWGLRFPNPAGVAAGMDKRGAAVPAWAALGFGFCELGGVTREAQPGNPAPRMFRAVAEEALVNRMGFNNPGAEALAERLAGWKKSGLWPKHPVGINLGKSKNTPLERAAEDYAGSFGALRDYGDFFVVNVSSPNTPGLRQLQDRAALDEILAAIEGLNGGRKPVLVKVAPDLSIEALDEILEVGETRRVAGYVAANTTIARPETKDAAAAAAYAEAGGLSGRPLRTRSTEVVRHLHLRSEGKAPIIGVGGIFSAADAWEKITAGASLVQVYTGMVYEGPGIARAITEGLMERLERAGMKSLSEAVGLHAREPKQSTARSQGEPALAGH